MIKQWLTSLKDLIIQEVPPEIAYCEFDCRCLSCQNCPFAQLDAPNIVPRPGEWAIDNGNLRAL